MNGLRPWPEVAAELIAVAARRAPADMVIRNCAWVNVHSREVIEGADYVEPADLVVQALGFEPEAVPVLWGVPDLAVTRWGTIKADFRSHATNLPGVYAAGDIVRGASLVVWAIRDGREAADAILAYLAQPAAVAAE